MTNSLLLKPVDRGRLTSTYGMRLNPILKRRQMHRGIDWAAPRGSPVRAAGDGVVVAAGRLGSYGHYLRIDHGGRIATAYAHLDGYARGLRPGRLVRQGELIGRVGSTGRATAPHLHYEVLVAGRQVDPLGVPSTMAALPLDPPLRVTRASFQNEPENGLAALAAAPDAGDLGHPTRADVLAGPLEAPAAPELIRVEDLLRRYAP